MKNECKKEKKRSFREMKVIKELEYGKKNASWKKHENRNS